MINTRFNPSANGGLHLGHVYIALINEALARNSGGGFFVRWDDNNPPYKIWGRERLDAVCAAQREELEWLGFRADAWIQQSRIEEETTAELAALGWVPMAEDDPIHTPELISEPYIPLYPCTPTLTAYKVVMDWQMGVNLLVRGIDLITEYAHYQYYCRMFDLPQPRHVYLPRLGMAGWDISKSHGTHGATIMELRSAGYTPGQIRDMVGKACLRWYVNGWTLENIKPEPRL